MAIRPPAEACAALAAAVRRAPDPRWHVTLAFLGEQSGPDAFLIPLRQAVSGSTTLQLRLSGGLTFGGRVLSAGLAGDLAGLDALAAAVRQACRAAGAAVEDRPFRSHLTVARGRALTVPPALRDFEGRPWTVRQVELVRSRLGRRAEHEVLHRFRTGTGTPARVRQPAHVPEPAP